MTILLVKHLMSSLSSSSVSFCWFHWFLVYILNCNVHQHWSVHNRKSSDSVSSVIEYQYVNNAPSMVLPLGYCCFWLLSADQHSLLMLLLVSEVFNHCGDCITEEIIVLAARWGSVALQSSSIFSQFGVVTVNTFGHIKNLKHTMLFNSLFTQLIKEVPLILGPPVLTLLITPSPLSLYPNHPPTFKGVMIKPLLKKNSDLHPDALSNYRHISNHLFLSEVQGRDLASPLADFLQHGLFEKFVGARCLQR